MAARSAKLSTLSTNTPSVMPKALGALGMMEVGRARSGARVSMRTLCVMSALLPARSVAVTVRLAAASPVGIWVRAKDTRQLPSLATVVLCSALPQTTRMVSPLAVPLLLPETNTPEARSPALTTLSVATGLTVTPGAVVSMVHCWLLPPGLERLPAASFWRTSTWPLA